MISKFQVGFTASSFDLLHAGHIAMLQEAKSVCDKLIVGLHIDPSIERASKSPPMQTVVERYIQLSAVKYVDEIIPYETEKDLENILMLKDINVRIIGIEYMNEEFTGKSIQDALSIKTYFNRRLHAFSSSTLRSQIFNREDNNG